MKLIDTHLHVWDLKQFPYSWCQGIPALNKSFLLADYQQASAGSGIEKTVFVECDVDEPHSLHEARHAQTLPVDGMIAAGRPEREGFQAYLDELVQFSKVRGVRRVLHTQPDELSQHPLFAENLRLLPRYNLTFDLCVLARQLPMAIALVRKCPAVTFILDHCGVPDVQGRALDPWRSHVNELAAFSNVNCKISGLVAYAAEGWQVEDLRPWVNHVLECFGWDRVIWGGDWPICTLTASLMQWVDTTRMLTQHAAESDREKLYWRNAERIYRI